MARVRGRRDDTGEVVGEWNSESEAREGCRGLVGMNIAVRFEEVDARPIGTAAARVAPKPETAETSADRRQDDDENSAAWRAVERHYPRIVRDLRSGKTVRVRLDGTRLVFPKK